MTALFTDKVVLVTGGGSGIGRASALMFAKAGATVVVVGRNAEPLAQTAKLIQDTGGAADTITADITDASACAHMVDTTVSRHGGLHVAVNNAGLVAVGAAAELDEHSWDRVIRTNLTGTWLAMKHQINHMRGNGGGAVVNISSNLGAHQRIPGLSAYIAAKAGVAALTRAAAREYIAEGVRINVVSPGPVDAPMSLRPGETAEDRAARLKGQLPIDRIATADEIANAILWVASDEASYLVGHDLVIDGGSTA